jgi:spoIIIJ-associated protein
VTNTVEAEGWTIEEAIASALAQLRAEREQVEIDILSQATKGFLGIGGKKARVRATLRTPLSVQTLESEAVSLPRERLGKESLEEVVSPVTDVTLSPRELGERAGEVLKEILRRMGVSPSISVEVQDEGVVINILDAADGVIIGRGGQTLDALEYLVNRIITLSEESEMRVILDAEGYRERRRKSLENLALRLGERAKRRRKTVTLNPLSPRDRRVIHLALEGDPLVTTKSMGKGYFRRLCIVPEEGARRERGKGTPQPSVGE